VSSKSGAPRDGHPHADQPAPGAIDPATGQHTEYWVLSEDERARGFVRPVRRTYLHVGARPKHETRPLTEDEARRYEGVGYVLFEQLPEMAPRSGRFWTQAQLDSGCGGAATTMSQAIAETYAREPGFYGSTFCCACRGHFPVGEFVWDGTDEVVGS
jgi:hypothetical protein